MSSVFKHAGEPFSKVYIHSFKRLDGYGGDFSPNNLVLWSLSASSGTSLFSDVCYESQGLRRDWEQVHFVRGGGGSFVFIEMLHKVNYNFRIRLHHCIMLNEEWRLPDTIFKPINFKFPNEVVWK